jgi:alpha-tubulin suppressor-like RCC1 family protein
MVTSRRPDPRTSPLAVLLLVLLAGCEKGPVTPGGEAISQVVLNPATFSMAVGDQLRLDVFAANASGWPLAGGSVEWASRNPLVAAVDSLGLIRGLLEGTAEISALVSGIRGTAVATITPAAVSEWREHSCFLANTGSAWCWGRGVNGELGNGLRGGSAIPVRVALDQPLALVSTGASHSCAVTTTGSGYCWGRGAEGQLGNGGLATFSHPVQIMDALGYRTVSAGGQHSCGVTNGGDTRCWGASTYGQVGNGATVSVSTPVQVQTAQRFTVLSAGARHTCALTGDGQAYCWGDNHEGQLGDGTTIQRNAPVTVATTLRFLTISAGARHTCAIASDQTPWCWGDNGQGQLGNGTLTSSTVPRDVKSSPGFRLATVAAGGSHTCGINSGGVAYCWGAGQFGQLGSGGSTLIGNPLNVGVALFGEIMAGTGHSCGVSSGGTVLCWGLNVFGQLGLGDTNNRSAPNQIRGELRFRSAGG